MGEQDYRSVNRANWDERAPAHAASPDYAVDRLVADPGALSDVVTFDLPRLGDLRGLRGVHLQCHIGTDTLSLSRLGAQMSGLDFSAPALAEARSLAERAGADIDYVQGDVDDAPDLLGRAGFDLVFTGVGALCWLPRIDRWAAVVAELLRPGGRLFLREGHPMMWTLQVPREDGLLVVVDPYFETEAPAVYDEAGTYVSTDSVFENNVTHTWNHGLGEVVTALLDHGMRITALVEHDSVPWLAVDGQMAPIGGGEYRLVDRPERLPHTYTLQAVKT
jgi:SAM-dependent methyltransferase